MSDSISVAQFGSNCPECGTSGQPSWTKGVSEHVDQPGHCHTYSWDNGGAVVARDVHTKAERDARSDAIDARMKRLNPFKRRKP